MSEYELMVARQRKWMLYLLAIFILGAVFSPYPDIFNGLLLGGIVSFYNLWNLGRNINKFGEAAIENNPKIGIGTFTRMASAGLAILIAMKFEVYFNLIGVIIGIIISYIIIVVDFGIRIFTQKD